MPAVIIIGGHRTGTSVTAQVIHKLGFPAAPTPKRLLRPQPGRESDNPDGYWEDVAFVRLHRRMLAEEKQALGGWRNPRRDDAVICKLTPAYRQLVRERQEHSANWCLKDPRLCLLGDVLFDVLESENLPCQVVTTCREQCAIQRSLMRRGLPEADATRIAEQFELNRLEMCHRASSHGQPVLELALLSKRGPAELLQEIRRLRDFLGVPETRETMALSKLIRSAPSDNCRR